VIQKSLQDPLAERLLAGEIKDGEKVRVGAGADALTFEVKGRVVRAA
jgi:ATP-dependent Clp protease ATP-binding subunit ClpB